MFSLQEALITSVVGQRRTGKNKQFVILRDDEVYKGPYTASGRLTNIRERSEAFRLWEIPHVVLPLREEETKDGQFVVYPNLAKEYPLEYTIHKESFSSYEYRILTRKVLVKLGDYLKLKDSDWVYDEASSLLMALCASFVLKIGDMNLANILVDVSKKSLHIIDYDDNLAKDRDDAMFYFNKPPGKTSRWYEKMRHHYATVAKDLESLLDHPYTLKMGFQERVQSTIDLLLKYSDEPKTSTSTTSSSQENLGRMVWAGPLSTGTRSYTGYTTGLLKSALQKYIRRGMVDKALQAAFELFRFSEVGGDNIVSNLYNRLSIISCEDIGPANLPLCGQVCGLVNDKNRDPAILAAMVEHMALSQKTRMMSHVWYVFCTHDGRAISPLPLEKDFDPGEDIQENVEDHILSPYALAFLERMKRKDLNAFTWIWYFFKLCADKKVKLTPMYPMGKRTTNPKILLWEMVRKLRNDNIVDALCRSFFEYENRNRPIKGKTSRDESRCYLATIVLSLLFPEDQPPIDMNVEAEKWRDNPRLQELLTGKYSFQIDESYVHDKHTVEGRSMGATRSQFVTEGAHVENQHPLYFNQPLFDTYCASN